MTDSIRAMRTGTLALSSITIPEGKEKINQGTVDELAESIENLGLLNPIMVYESEDSTVYLVSGQHRYKAYEKLGYDEIEIHYIDEDEFTRDMMTIDENVCRIHLDATGKTLQLAKRLTIFNAKKAAQSNIAQNLREKKRGRPEGFAADHQKKTGTPKRTTQASLRRANKIAPDVFEAIKELPSADKGVELDALAGLSHDEQRQAVERVKSSAAKNFRDARDYIEGNDSVRYEMKLEKDWANFKKRWATYSSETQARILDFVTIALSEEQSKIDAATAESQNFEFEEGPGQ